MHQQVLFNTWNPLGSPPLVKSYSDFWDDVVSGRIANRIKEAANQKTLSSSQEVYNAMKPIFAQEDDVERMYGIYTDRKNHVISIELISRGSITGASVYPREIIKRILDLKASGLVLSHNHPSGDSTPSPEDISITKAILLALHCIGASLLDHVVVGNNGCHYSFADSTILANMRESIKNVFDYNPH
jgi:DNA repair protein RadC